MQKIEPFTYGNFYHVYKRGIDGCDIFRENENYEYFLNAYLYPFKITNSKLNFTIASYICMI